MYSNMGYTNGHHQGVNSHRDRVKRGNRRSRESLRVLEHQQQQQTERKPTTPCTDFDVAYFNSYAHVGIHEEMIKVFFLLTPSVSTCLVSSASVSV